MEPEKLKEILENHRDWLKGPGGRRAVLSGADLSRAVLSGADLSGADLSGADLRGADLRGAALRGADLRAADLRDADLRDADLRDADLSRADLSDADLRGAVLNPRTSRWQWAQKNALEIRAVGGRSLGLFRRTAVSQHMQPAKTYKPGQLYVAEHLSLCPVTDCHPGLYVAGKEWNLEKQDTVLACAWVDELEGPLNDKARTKHLYILADSDEGRAAFERVTTADMTPPERA